MHLETLAVKIPRNKKTRLDEPHKIGLMTAWTLIKPNLKSHARKIFANFYEQNPEYLKHFDPISNEVLHSHSEKVLETITSIIENGLHNEEEFDGAIEEIVKRHSQIFRRDVVKLNEIIISYVENVLKLHMTKTLREALNFLFAIFESRFADPSDINEDI